MINKMERAYDRLLFVENRNVFFDRNVSIDIGWIQTEFRDYWKFPKTSKIYGHLVKRQKWRLQTIFWGVGVF